MKHLLPTLALFTIGLAPVSADLNADLAFTSFSNVDLNSLADGKILQNRGGLVTFKRGIITQSLYIVNADLATVQERLTHWSPAGHSDLKVWAHKDLPAKPTLADFDGLAHLPENKSTKFQVETTAEFEPGKLEVSSAEADIIKAAAAQEKEPKALYAKAWGQILLGRINNFLAGHADSSGDVKPLDDVKALLHSDAKVYGQFQRFLNQTPARTLSGNSAQILPPDLYYDMFDVQGSAALGTGASYHAGNQFVDFEYYTNYGVYCTVELEQLWPITVNGKNMTLVWRDDLVSAPSIAYLHGTERLAADMLMPQEIKQAILAFRSEFK